MTNAAEPRNRYVVLVADKLSEDGLAFLRAHQEFDVRIEVGQDESRLCDSVRDADALIIRSAVTVTPRVLAAAEKLRVIGRAGIGVENVDIETATRRGILVMNCPEANADTTAEHSIALLLALARHIPQADRSIRAGSFERARFLGVEVQDKVLGILGGGNIGVRVAKRARALGMEPIVYDPALAPDALRDVGATVLPLEVVLAKADFVSIHVPLVEATRQFVNAAMLARMKRGVRIIHCARGGIVDDLALADALRSGHVAGAALDVFEVEPPPRDHPLLALDNVIVTPHLGASTLEARARAAVDICRQVAGYLLDGELRNAVNLPRLSTSAFRAAQPWLDLGRRLGRLTAGIAPARVDRLEAAFHGGVAKLETSTILRAAVAGFLGARSSSTVNEVNAPLVAQENGLRFDERHSEHMRDFASLLAVHAHTGGIRTSVAGALFGHRQARIVRIDEHPIEALAEGLLLIVRNHDRPGVVGRIGTILGNAGVNIRAMHLSPPRRPDGDALAVLNVDSHIPEAALSALRALPDAVAVDLIDLDRAN